MNTAISPITSRSALDLSREIKHADPSYLNLLDPITKTTTPSLDRDSSLEVAPANLIFARMLDKMQSYVNSAEEPTKLKQTQVGNKITKTKQQLRKEQEKIVDTQKTIETWDFRKTVANQVMNGVSVFAGGGLILAGDYWTGGSLVASGVGNAASDLMRYLEWNPTLTAATSVVSGIIGVVGGLGGSVANLYYRNFNNPQGLDLAWNQLAYWCEAAATATGIIGGAVSGTASVVSNSNMDLLGQLEALQSQTSSSLRLLQDKYTSATTAFQGTAKNFSDLFRNITKAQSRYTRDVMRMVTAEFPA